MSNNDVTVRSSGGIGFLGLLTILFIGLKLGGVINWSWLWVLAPLWLPVAVLSAVSVFVLLVAFSFGIAAGLIKVLETRRKYRR